MHQTFTKSWKRCAGGMFGTLALAVIVLGSCPGQAQAAELGAESSAETAAVGFAGAEIVRSLQQRGTNPANFKIAEADADIILDAAALTVGPEGK